MYAEVKFSRAAPAGRHGFQRRSPAAAEPDDWISEKVIGEKCTISQMLQSDAPLARLGVWLSLEIVYSWNDFELDHYENFYRHLPETNLFLFTTHPLSP